MRSVALLLSALCAASAFHKVTAVPTPKVNSIKYPGHGLGHLRRPSRRSTYTNAVNTTQTGPVTSAPKSNVWISLNNDEAADVISFLHDQPELNLTAVENATSWDNTILVVDLANVKKSDALAYLDGSGQQPQRYAKASISFAATEKPYYQEFLIGPIPVDSTTTYRSYDEVTTKGTSKITNYDADEDLRYDKFIEISEGVEDIITDLTNQTLDNLDIWGIDPLWHENGRTMIWVTYWANPEGEQEIMGGQTLLPQGLFFKYDMTGRDPNGWGLVAWLYNDVLYSSTEEFRAAWASGKIAKLEKNASGPHVSTDRQGDALPMDDIPPPMMIQPAGQRFAIDHDQKYIEWGEFSFYVTFTRDTGTRLFDIKFKGERIIYELGLQEAIAHYAGNDPVQSGIGYLDSYYGFGPYAFNLVPGYDVPAYASFLNSTFHAAEESRTHPASIAVYEIEETYPLQRHSDSKYISVTKNIALMVRSVSTVGNYDYTFTYEFFLDGSIKTEVKASGYIQSAFYANNGEYGYHIHDGLSGSMHDHVLTFKADIDIHGTKNTLHRHSVVPAEVKYVWSNTTRSTMKVQKDKILNEADGKIYFRENEKDTYIVVNEDKLDKYGEAPGYRIMPHGGMHLTIQESDNLFRTQSHATHQLYVTRQHDTEPNAIHAWNNLDPHDPIVEFDKFFNNESLAQEDVVLWFNLGMHHVPSQIDLPNTIMTTAQASVLMVPHNFAKGDASRVTRQMIRINYNDTGATEIRTFGSVPAMGTVDLARLQYDPTGYTGDIAIRKFPYDPSNPYNSTESI